MATAPISTNPLDASLNKIMGTNPKKKETDPLSPISYQDDATFRPGEDVINVSGNPATGATTAEEWTHEVQLAELRQKALEEEYQQRAAAEQAAFESQQAALVEANRQAQLGLSTSAEQRAWQESGLKTQQVQQQMALDRAAEQRAGSEFYMKYGGVTPADLERWKATEGDYRSAMGSAYRQGNAATDPSFRELSSRSNYVPSGTYIPNVGTFNQPMMNYGQGGGYRPASGAPRYVQVMTGTGPRWDYRAPQQTQYPWQRSSGRAPVMGAY